MAIITAAALVVAAAVPTLASEVENQNIVMVTQGTCKSNGYQPINDIFDCTSAARNLDLDLGASAAASQSGSCFIVERSGRVQAIYKGGHSSCSHREPCICSGQSNDNPVCETGEFDPDPTKYYTIKSPNGRYLTSMFKKINNQFAIFRTPNESDNLDPWKKIDLIFNLDLKTMNEVHKRAQWRFIGTGAGKWIIRNRATGEDIKTDYNTPVWATGEDIKTDYNTLELNSKSSSTFSGTCDKDQVFFAIDGTDGDFPRDCCEDYVPRDGTYDEHPMVYIKQKTFRALRRSGCVKKKRSCTSMFGSGYKQRSRSLCGFFNHLHRLYCERTVATPTSMKVKQRWFVEELDEFFRAAEYPGAPVVFEAVSSPSVAADSMATGAAGAVSLAVAVGAVALQGVGVPAPVGVAALSFGVSLADDLFGFLPDEPDLLGMLADQINESMQKLASDMEKRTNALISSALANSDAEKISNLMLSRRRWFLTEYPDQKHNEIRRYQDALEGGSERDRLLKLAEIDDLADALLFEVNQYDTDIATFFGFDTAPTELNAKRSDVSLDILKLATVELLLMDREGILLKAYARPDESCDALVDLQNLPENVDRYRRMLLGAKDTLVAYYLNQEKCASTSCQTQKSYVKEFLWDVEHFSYPVHEQMAFFDSYVSGTLSMCERLRADEEWKDLFETVF